MRINNFEKVAIIKSDNKYFQYSFQRAKYTGYFLVNNQYEDLPHRDANFHRKSLGMKLYPSLYYNYYLDNINATDAVSHSLYNNVTLNDDFDFSLNDYVDFFKISEKYGYNIYSQLSIICDQSLNKNYDLCYDYIVKHEYKRLFPKKDFVPEPSYSFGTGFAIKSNGYVVTNYHVIKEYEKNKYSSNASINILINANETVKEFKAALVGFDSENDLAILKINEPSFNGFGKIPFNFNVQGNIGQEVFTLGFPLQNVMGQNIKLSTGMITGLTGIQDENNCYTLNLGVNPGNSGGPLFSKSGSLLGIISSRLNDEAIGVKVESVSYAIKSKYLKDLLIKNDIELNPTLPITHSKTTSLENKITTLSPYVVQVKVRGKY